MSLAYWFLTNLLQPFTVLMLLLGVCAFWPRSPRPRWLRISYALVYLYCTPVTASLPIWWLETRFPRWIQRPDDLDAIIVLSAGAVVPDPVDEPMTLDDESLRRCERAARLYRQGAPCPIVASGGTLYPGHRPPPVSHLMKEALEAWGVDPNDVVVEDQSRNTAQNAEFTANIVRRNGWKRIALVTHATHLWRAERMFRAHGVQTIPVGCTYRNDEFSWDVFAFLPRSRAVQRHEEAMHELIGGLYAILRGQWRT
jgi:uncharacterized SAM-binding protein YcdF (DUF218 family)